jgi:nitrite reductase/ring-hydroxylating ferredoxin subunit
MLARGQVVIIVDPAKGTAKSKDPDFTGIVVLLVLPAEPPDPSALVRRVKGDDGFKVFVVEAFGFRAATRVQADVISALCHHWGAAYLLVEDQGLSSLHEWVYQPAAGSPAPPPAMLIPYSTKESKELKIGAVTPLLDRAVMGLPPCVMFHPRVVSLDAPPSILQQDPTLQYLHRYAPSLAAAPQIELHRNLYDEAVNFGVSSHDDLIDPLAQGLRWVNTQLHGGYSDDEQGGLEIVSLNY